MLYWQSPDSGGTGSRTPVRKQDVEGKDTGTRPRTGRLPSPTFILPSAPRLALTRHTSLSRQRPGGDCDSKANSQFAGGRRWLAPAAKVRCPPRRPCRGHSGD